MEMSNPATAKTAGSYELMWLRIQKIVNSHAAQKTRRATVSKEINELDEDWSQLLSDLGETDGVKVALTETGAAKITWQSPDE
ncbi:DUF1654 domain-containing protein [Pseudomonas taetrolens]|uniref:DUF1654 domain-containing protein n=1 Tax=Pseudomonas taetrolens TaxID=47884 RepID=UPI0030D8B54B